MWYLKETMHAKRRWKSDIKHRAPKQHSKRLTMSDVAFKQNLRRKAHSRKNQTIWDLISIFHALRVCTLNLLLSWTSRIPRDYQCDARGREQKICPVWYSAHTHILKKEHVQAACTVIWLASDWWLRPIERPAKSNGVILRHTHGIFASTWRTINLSRRVSRVPNQKRSHPSEQHMVTTEWTRSERL